MPAEDRVQVVLQGATYRDWLEVDIDSDVMTPADAFSIKVRAPGRKAVAMFREGATLDVYIGEDRQMAGMIDEVHVRSMKGQDTLELVGRDKGGYLVDSDADPIRASHYTLKTLAEKLLKPSWGIREVIVSNEDNRKRLLGKRDRKSRAGRSSKGPLFTDTPRQSTSVEVGRTVAQILDDRTRQLGLTWWLTADGRLFIGRPNYNQEAAFRFTCLEREDPQAKRKNNCEAEVRRSIADRYSELTVVGQGSASSGLFSTPARASEAKFKASAKDPDLVARGIVRPHTVHDGDVQTRQEAQARADYEQGRRRLSALTIRVTTPGFRQEGRLFTVDTLATAEIGAAGISGVYWVAQRRFRETRQERRTELRLHEKGVWLA
jgi:prophage tail gpP-like protein